jgi:hypothetical protein
MGALCIMGMTQPVVADEESKAQPLPQWNEEDLRAMRDTPNAAYILGGVLWPGGMGTGEGMVTPNSSAPSNELLPTTAPPEIADRPEMAQPKTDLSHFMPPELLSVHSRPLSSLPRAGALRPVSSEFLAKVNASPAEERLIDPDGNLGETHREDIRRFLEFHANDARIDAYMLILAGDECLPATANLSAAAQGVLLNNEGCLVVYAYGQPSRSRLFLSRSVHSGVPAPYLVSLLEDCVSDAAQASDADDQLHRFLVRLSIRLFWLERMLPPLSPALVAKVAAQPLPETPSALTEIGLHESTASEVPAMLDIQMDKRVWICLVTLLLASFITFCAMRWQRYRLRHYVWLLPEPAGIQPRLGGQQCGGSAAWVRYR